VDHLNESRDLILGLLGEAGRPLALREVLRRLGPGRDERQEIKGVLRELLTRGEVVKLKGTRLGLPGPMGLLVGRLHATAGGLGFVRPEPRRKGDLDVYVSALDLKQALHGDRVVVRVERRTPRGAEGRIIRVLERAQSQVVGRFESDGPFGAHLVPFDRRILHEFLVPAGAELGAASGDMVTAKIVRPPSATRNGAAEVVKILGRLDEPGVDLRVILAKYDLPEAFPADVETEAARVPPVVRPEDLAGRTDFRDWPTVTIDPKTARDHDDALSLDRRPDGSWRLGVHIADVAHYVPEGSALDREAYARGTSVYFPGHVVPMLPEVLSSGICSLVDGQDRLCHTVILEIDPDGRVRSSEFHDGVIRSMARLSYPEAQGLIDGDEALRARHPSLVAQLMDMDALAQRMRARRQERGSLDLDLPEPELRLDASGQLVGILAQERLSSMRLVEEFMLAANEAVAAQLHQAGAGALFRVHEPPDPERVAEFCELVASFGYRVPQGHAPEGQPEVRPEDFQQILKQLEGKPEEKLVSMLLLRTLKLARYHQENLGHFGLATAMYAHFTSPIRRYPDLVVHRRLRALRRQPDRSAEERLVEMLPEMGRHLSETERKASEAERELLEWKKVRYMADRLGDNLPGFVTGVQAFGLFVELDDIYVQGLVHVSSMSDDYYRFDQRGHTLKGENTRRTYRLGDRVTVRVARVDLERRQVDFALLDLTPRTGGQDKVGRRRRVPGAVPSGPRGPRRKG
jgi:ribonuclease R